ncbi:MAG: ABC transporter ATP-binding protein/permease [Ruminococcaceae bacterium]|nr:ABC transporter ATP-binding protein/permease [Oscillospiraceae bacterium]
MLNLNHIVKEYTTGDQTVLALNDVSIRFRRQEFVSILGPSGCGKTTLLNIIGGLDQYTSGDLMIDGVSTKQYKEKDWDAYRNHSVGFVFQNYNLIPHQTVLANVELALTLSGVSRAERRERAINALKQVGLEDQMQKKPNQMSGGQMQRVAIARALVNDPEILLADEPTGALDTQTSIQIMEILKNISKTKLIIMVTHNPDLAEQYSSRIVRLLDGQIVGDSAPLSEEAAPEKKPEEKPAKKKKAKRSMSFWTALSLSFTNLLTKKGRTFMTSFAGSIGIIGIALILSVSSGVNNYINYVQRDTLASYPIQLEEESTDLSSLITTIMGARNESAAEKHEGDFVYESSVTVDLMNSINSLETTHNDLASFKKYVEEHPEKFDPYVSAMQYTYDFRWRILTNDTSGAVIKSDTKELLEAILGSSNGMMGSSVMTSNYRIWQEMLRGKGDELVNSLIPEEYDLIYGTLPTSKNEILLVVNENNTISDLSLYALGLRTKDEILQTIRDYNDGKIIDTSTSRKYTYEEICNLQFRLYLASECYQLNDDGTYTDASATPEGRAKLFYPKTEGMELKICGIIRPKAGATSTVLSGTLAYTAALADYVLEQTAKNPLLQKQIDHPDTDILTGLPFSGSDEEKIAAANEAEQALSETDRIELRKRILATPTNAKIDAKIQEIDYDMLRKAGMEEEMRQYGITDEESFNNYKPYLSIFLSSSISRLLRMQKEVELAKLSNEEILAAPISDEQYLAIYEESLAAGYSTSTYADNLKLLGYVKADAPRSIAIYANTFENKDQIANLIGEYNASVPEKQKIEYTDYVALLMSSITTIVNAITYVLVAFVAISLVVSSIMIGIITYISVLERTKEIGILRSIGASRRDVGRVFNAETLIIGFVAGTIGIVISVLLDQIINIILRHLTGIASLKAVLPPVAALILVLISMGLTFIAGLVPAGFASRKNPVEALRSE